MVPSSDSPPDVFDASTAEIYERYYRTVYRVAYHNIMQRASAEDITQDVFLKLLKHKKTFQDEQHLLSWLLRVTVNRSRDVIRRIDHQNILADRQGLVAEGNGDIPVEFTDHLPLYEALDTLSAKERTLLYLYYHEGYTCKEIAGILHTNTNTVTTRLRRVRKKLSVQLNDEERSTLP